ncbi:MAG: hypothetical protein O2798_06080 [Chloroflexi bacterium]|nr:hypothetical protein [Chloroflexota bacterium]MDA1240398.1 hypothetical protein [Chloroflexota bacterium]
MPVATYVPAEPLTEQAEFLVLLKEADGSAVAGAPVHLHVASGHLRSDGRGVGGGPFLFVQTDESGGVRFVWVAPNADERGVALEACSARGTTLVIRRL